MSSVISFANVDTVAALVSDHLGNSKKWSRSLMRMSSRKRPRPKTIEAGGLRELLA